MALTQGSKVYFAYKKEATPNVEETGSGGTTLRRVTGQLDLVKPEVVSQEKRTDFQDVCVDHGTRSVNWQLVSELFGGDYEEFLAAILRRDFTSVTTISASAGDGFSVTSGAVSRAAGGGESFITDGLRKGLAFRFTNMTTAGINSRNMRITGNVGATSFTAVAVDGGAALADSTSSETATIVIPGKITFIPSDSHTSDTFTIERHDSATDVSDVAYGCKVGQLSISVQPDQPISVTFSGIGIDRTTYTAGSAPSLTSPAAAGVGPCLSAAIGNVRVNGTAVAVVTGATVDINVGVSNRAVAFDNKSPDIFYGRTAEVTGTLTVLRQNATVQNLFDDETEASIELFCEAPGSNPKSFFNIFMPRVKFSSADMDDPDGAAVLTMNFRALKLTTGTGVDQTTIFVQDSSIA